MNQAAGVWLIAFMVFGLTDAASALEIAAHGAIGVCLLLTSWRVLTGEIGRRNTWLVEVAFGVGLAILPIVFHHPVWSLVALNDFALGVLVVVDALFEVSSAAVTRPSWRRPIATTRSSR